MIICMQCGHQNEGKNPKNCESCGAVLPRMDTSSVVRVEERSDRLREFSEAIEKVRSGAWGREDFDKFIHGLYDRLVALRVGIEGIITDNEYQEYASEEVQCGLEGMNLYEAGMVEMSLYGEDGDFAHLDRGMDNIVKGNAMLNEAKRLNRAGRQALAEMWEAELMD